MHASAESLARLAPKIVNLASVGRATDSNGLMTLDLAGALAGLPPGPWALAQLAWIDDRKTWGELVGHVERRLRVGGDWRAVIALGVAEYVWPPMCRDCCGRGEIKKKEYYGGCSTCRGSGYGKMATANLADACGVSSEEWKRVWASRYERVFRLVSGWGSEVLSHLHRRLGD